MLPRKDVRNVVRGVAELIKWCRVRNPEMVPRIKLLLVGGEAAQPDPLLTPEIGVLQHMAAELDIAEHVRFVGKRQQDYFRAITIAPEMSLLRLPGMSRLA